jgi:hypothetical protein
VCTPIDFNSSSDVPFRKEKRLSASSQVEKGTESWAPNIWEVSTHPVIESANVAVINAVFIIPNPTNCSC